MARMIIRMRDVRDRILGTKLFADPAWDLLLDLYVAAADGRKLTVGDACVGARVPSSTALRWIAEFERDGLIRRIPDAVDRRRMLVVLTESQLSTMDRLFASMALVAEAP